MGGGREVGFSVPSAAPDSSRAPDSELPTPSLLHHEVCSLRAWILGWVERNYQDSEEGDVPTASEEPGEDKGTHQTHYPLPPFTPVTGSPQSLPRLKWRERPPLLSHPQWEILAKKHCSGLEFRLQAPANAPSLEGLALEGMVCELKTALLYNGGGGHKVRTQGQAMRPPGAGVFREMTPGAELCCRVERSPLSQSAPYQLGLGFLWPNI